MLAQHGVEIKPGHVIHQLTSTWILRVSTVDALRSTGPPRTELRCPGYCVDVTKLHALAQVGVNKGASVKFGRTGTLCQL